MALFEKTVDGLNEFRDNINEIIANAILDNKREIIAVNVATIHSEGKLPEGETIQRTNKPYRVYSPGYTKFKQKLGIYQGHVDFTLSGNLLKSFDIIIEGTTVVHTAKKVSGDWDIVSLFRDVYGDFLGLSDEQWQEIAEAYLIPEINTQLLKIWQ